MKSSLVLLTLCLLLVVGCSNISEDKCKLITVQQYENTKHTGNLEGMNKAMSVCDERIEQVRKQYEVPKDCYLILSDYGTADYACKNFDELKYNITRSIYGKILVGE